MLAYILFTVLIVPGGAREQVFEPHVDRAACFAAMADTRKAMATAPSGYTLVSAECVAQGR